MNLLPGYYSKPHGYMREEGWTGQTEAGITVDLLEAKDDADDLLISRVEIWSIPSTGKFHTVFQCYDAETHEKVGDAERTICLTYDEAKWYYVNKYIL